MMLSPRKLAVATLFGAMVSSASAALHAQPASGADSTAAPLYTLEVDSDAPHAISFDALASRIGSDLGAPVTPRGALPASRAAISVRYRGRELTIRGGAAGSRPQR